MESLDDAGSYQVQISKQLDISNCCIQNAINKYKQLGTYEGSKRSGRRKKPDGRCFRHLKRLIKGNACLSAMNITSDLNISLPKPATTRTGRTYLKELGFEYLVKVKKQYLDIQHRQRRVAWCTKYMN